LSELGRREDALAAAEEATGIYRRLAAHRKRFHCARRFTIDGAHLYAAGG